MEAKTNPMTRLERNRNALQKSSRMDKTRFLLMTTVKNMKMTYSVKVNTIQKMLNASMNPLVQFNIDEKIGPIVCLQIKLGTEVQENKLTPIVY